MTQLDTQNFKTIVSSVERKPRKEFKYYLCISLQQKNDILLVNIYTYNRKIKAQNTHQFQPQIGEMASISILFISLKK